MVDYSTSDVPEIFVAYAREDQARVEKIVRILKDRRFSVFWDLDIRVGENWHEMLSEKLDEAGCVLVVWSKFSAESDPVKEEALEADKLGKYFPVVLDDLKEPPLYFRSKQYLKLGGSGEDSRCTNLEDLYREIIDFVDRRRLSLEPDVDSAIKPSDLENLLIQTVNRTRQMQAIQTSLNEARMVSMFLYSGKPDDWPETLANHLQFNLNEASKVDLIYLGTGNGLNAFKNSLMDQVLPGGGSDEHALLTWFRSGPSLRIILCVLEPQTLGWEFRYQVRGAAEYLKKVEELNTGNRAVVLFACIVKHTPTRFTNWWRSRVCASEKGIRFFILDNLEPINKVHAHSWVVQLQAKCKYRYNFDDIRSDLLACFKKNRPVRYMKLRRSLQNILLKNRC